MKLKYAISAAAVSFALGAGPAALASDRQAGATASTFGEGVAAAAEDGAVAGGVVGARGQARADEVRARGDSRRDRERRSETPSVNSATTYGAGAVYTDRRNASAAVTTGAAASGQGVQSAGSTVDAYAETTRDGSSADMYGDSAATSGERP